LESAITNGNLETAIFHIETGFQGQDKIIDEVNMVAEKDFKDSLKMLTETPLDHPPASKIWYHDATFREARWGHPNWSKSEQIFEVFNSRENKMKQYRSLLIQPEKGIKSDESLKMWIETPSYHLSTSETWYHATTFREAEEIMKRGFSFKKCMKNRNFSDQDGIYFTDSIASAKYLFQQNAFEDFVVFPYPQYKKWKTPAEQNQNEIVVLAFTYHKEENNLLEKYKIHSIDLRDHASEERLKKIVNFFSKDPLPTSDPTVEEHGLDSDYEDDIEYIIGPHVFISGPNNPQRNVFINRSLTQLCVRFSGMKSMKKDFESLLQKEVFIVDLEANEFCK
jgi:hypothetical protein